MNEHQESERHASWAELFFDLVAVVGVAQLAHLLLHPTLPNVGLYVLLYLAFWTVWMSFTMYANALAEDARNVVLVLAMVGMAVMAAAVLGVQEDRANAFAVGYIVSRLLASRSWRGGHTMRIAVDWPIAHASFGVLPWIASLWADGGWQYGLWALGLALDLTITLVVQAETMARAALERVSSRPRAPQRFETVLAGADAPHLAERLGLFVIIVLGEGVAQVVISASGATWDRSLLGVSLAAFLLIVSLWLQSIYGFGGVPLLTAGQLRHRGALLVHCVITGLIAAVAAGLGGLVHHQHGDVPAEIRWTLCAAVAGYCAVSALVGLVAGSRRSWVFGLVLPATAAVLAVGVFGGGLTAGMTGLLVALPVVVQAMYAVRARRRQRAGEQA